MPDLSPYINELREALAEAFSAVITPDPGPDYWAADKALSVMLEHPHAGLAIWLEDVRTREARLGRGDDPDA